MDSNYRPCVLAVFTNASGQVLVGERTTPPGAWQFPQGGIDPGESPEDAVKREMREELGVTEVVIVERTASTIRYHFPPGLDLPLAKHFKGQDQVWFKLVLPPGHEPSLERATDQEFGALAWVSPQEALRRVVSFKRAAYEQGLAELGLLPRAGA